MVLDEGVDVGRVGDGDATLDALMRMRAVGVARGRGPLVVAANAEFLRISGRSAEDLDDGGFPWRDLATGDAPDHLVATVQTMLHAGQVAVTTDVARPDGTRVPVMLAAVKLPGAGPPWLGLLVDIADEQWRSRLASHEAAIVATLLDDAPVGFALFDRELRFVRVNRELAAMNGLPPEAHLGRPAFEVVPGVRGSAEAALRSVLTTGVPLRDVEVTGTTQADPGVEHVWLESFFPVRSHPSAAVQGIAAIARDETRLRALQAELAMAAERQRAALEQLQRALLPESMPRVRGWGLEARYISASDEVRLGGDWYDVVEVGSRVVLSVGDAVGHGLAAVGTMAHARAATRAYLSEGYGPGDVLSRVGRLLLTPGVHAMATAVVVSLDPATGEVEYASGGHPYPLVCGADGGTELLRSAQGPLLGAVTHEYATARARVPEGGALVLFTDGLVERRGESLAQGFRRLRAAGAAAAPAPDPAVLVDTLLAACRGSGERDDTCVLTAVRAVSDPSR